MLKYLLCVLTSMRDHFLAVKIAIVCERNTIVTHCLLIFDVRRRSRGVSHCSLLFIDSLSYNYTTALHNFAFMHH